MQVCGEQANDTTGTVRDNDDNVQLTEEKKLDDTRKKKWRPVDAKRPLRGQHR